MTALAKPSVAFAYAAFFACAVTCVDLQEVLHEPLSVVGDYAAVLVLMAGAWAGGKDWLRGRVYQAAAWAFMVSLLFRSLVRDVQDVVRHAADPSDGWIVAAKFALFVVATAAIFATAQNRD